MDTVDLMKRLEKKGIQTWFDIGLFLDGIKDNRNHNLKHSFDGFKKSIKGVAFLAFDFGIDGVSIEMIKYAKALKRILGSDLEIHCIGGKFFEEVDTLFSKSWKRKTIEAAVGFDAWQGYDLYFNTYLNRGSDDYNRLASLLWSDTLIIVKELSDYCLNSDVKLFVPVNTNSNPGNVAFALALVIVSEYLKIPVLSSHHDFYWEDGARRQNRELEDKDYSGARDHFFENAHIGEVFSPIEVLYPWNSPLWFHAVINSMQRSHLIEKFGISPSSIIKMPTAIDLNKYRAAGPDDRNDIFSRLNIYFAGGDSEVKTKNIFELSDKAILDATSPMLLGQNDEDRVDFSCDNILFLQPTRVIKRKRIELDFKFVDQLLKCSKFENFFNDNINLSITIIISGPVAAGNTYYFNYLLNEYRLFLKNLSVKYRDRIFLGFAFGLENSHELKCKKMSDLKIEELFGVSSMIFLPSKTEGRGLPILESASAGVPLVCSRYSPEHIFVDVIGENLEYEKRLKVFEFRGVEFSDELLDKVSNVFIDPKSLKEMVIHNREVIKRRYSMSILVKYFEQSLYGLWKNQKSYKRVEESVVKAFKLNKKMSFESVLFLELVSGERRKYLSGISPLEFMTYLKSLIDPSFFRVEEYECQSRVFLFAKLLVDRYLKKKDASRDEIILYYKHIETFFTYYNGKDKLAIDHSLSYRHRSRRHYPYRKLTEQELCGVVGIIFRQLFKGRAIYESEGLIHGYFRNLKSALMQLIGTTEKSLRIDFTDKLILSLKSNKEMVLFPTMFFKDEIRIFVKHVLKTRLNISLKEKIDPAKLNAEKIKDIGKVYIFVREEPLNDIHYLNLISWINNEASSDTKSLYEHGFIEVVKTAQIAVGPHLAQLGPTATKKLLKIADGGGFVVNCGKDSYMLDMIGMDSFRIGKVEDQIMAGFMGLTIDDSFIQWVPPYMSPTLAYPTPIQTAHTFSEILKSSKFKEAVSIFGEDKVLDNLIVDAIEFANPIDTVLDKMMKDNIQGYDTKNKEIVQKSVVNGKYDDGLSWSGAYALIKCSEGGVKFSAVSSGEKGRTLLSLIDQFEKETGNRVSFAWNGGYILNNELVGKLGLTEEYIGSPLGLFMRDGEILSLPLYNKSAYLVDKYGIISIKRVNLKSGLTIINREGRSIIMPKEARNSNSFKGPRFYDLLDDDKKIMTKNRVIYRFAANRVVEVLNGPTVDSETEVRAIPVGLTLSIPKANDFKLEKGDIVKFSIPSLVDYTDAIEAGPMLLSHGKVSIDMEIEGFKTMNSIKTQAARLDFTDMRGPKMGIGLTKEGNLILIAINGRIRESVGATHFDLAEILKIYGAVTAMGFDPGGSVTLVVDGKQLNISPYNSHYEENIYSLPPVPRTVGNGMLGTLL